MAADVVTWAKIVPRRDTADPSVGLAARIADPLWLLARQYQFGEFTGDDGGEPVTVEVDVTWTPFTRWNPGDLPGGPTDGLPFDRTHQPLESAVEDDRALAGARLPAMLDAVEAGARLVRALRSAGLAAVVDKLLTQHRLVADPRSAGDGGDLFAGRSVDGFSVRAVVDPDSDTVLPVGISAAQADAAQAAIADWVIWFDRRFGYSARPTAWVQDRLEHRFSVAAPHPERGELVFHAPEYLGQGVAWHELDLVPPSDPPAALGAAADAGQVQRRSVVARFPQHLRWPGMPVSRFWEMEDAAIDFGIVRLSPTDIAGLLAVDLAVTASTDWFVIGVPLPVGGAARVDRAIVQDVFDERTLIRVGPEVRADLGRLYEPAMLNGAADTGWLVLPPALVRRVDGPALEDVMLIRDEMANLAWAVELVAPLDDGEAVDVASRLPPRPPTNRSTGVPLAALEYRLTSGVPDNWRPLVPVRDADGRRIFVLGEVWGTEHPDAFTVLVEQIGEILDEEVPREGKRLQRFWQYGRWHDGSRHLWCGREIRAGRGEGNSGLRYDLALLQ